MNHIIDDAVTNCPICGKPLDAQSASIDHIVPVHLGGVNDSWNLRYICKECNSKKADHWGPLFEYYYRNLQSQSHDDPKIGLKIDYILRGMSEEDRKILLKQIRDEKSTYQYSCEPKYHSDDGVDYLFVAEGTNILIEKTHDRTDAMKRSISALKHYEKWLTEEREQINGCIFIFDKSFPVEEYRRLLEAYAAGNDGEVLSVYLDENSKVVIY